MPLTFLARAPVDETRRYSAAQIAAIYIDNRTNRLQIEVEYGDMVNGAFVRNENVSGRTHTLGPRDVARIASMLPPLPAAGMYANVKKVAWDALIAGGYEVGTIE